MTDPISADRNLKRKQPEEHDETLSDPTAKRQKVSLVDTPSAINSSIVLYTPKNKLKNGSIPEFLHAIQAGKTGNTSFTFLPLFCVSRISFFSYGRRSSSLHFCRFRCQRLFGQATSLMAERFDSLGLLIFFFCDHSLACSPLYLTFVLQCNSTDTSIARVLLEAHADTELTNNQGQTALYVAVANGNEGLNETTKFSNARCS
jgi:hypothetical protein